jgi:hypothetical protein
LINDLDNKINILGSKNTDSIDIDRRVSFIINNELSGFRNELNYLRSEVSSTSSTQRHMNVHYQSMIGELEVKLRRVLNITGVGTVGV